MSVTGGFWPPGKGIVTIEICSGQIFSTTRVLGKGVKMQPAIIKIIQWTITP